MTTELRTPVEISSGHVLARCSFSLC